MVSQPTWQTENGHKNKNIFVYQTSPAGTFKCRIGSSPLGKHSEYEPCKPMNYGDYDLNFELPLSLVLAGDHLHIFSVITLLVFLIAFSSFAFVCVFASVCLPVSVSVCLSV